MPRGLKRFQQSGQSHFVTFSCYQRRVGFTAPPICDLFLDCLENMRRRFAMCVYGYVVMPEHVHLLVNEPDEGTLADAIHFLKLSFAKRRRTKSPELRLPDSTPTVTPDSIPTVPQVRVRPLDANLGGSFWQKRYYDRNVRDADEFQLKLRYLHRNPVKRGLVQAPGDWKRSSYRHYALREMGVVESNPSGPRRIGNSKTRRPAQSVPQPRLASKVQTRSLGQPAMQRHIMFLGR